MSPLRKNAVVVGVLFLITHVTSVAARLLYGTGPESAELAGSVLEVVLALGVVGTAVALYPVARRASQSVAMGYVALRTLEAGVILTGVVTMLTLVGVRAGHPAIADVLVVFQDLTFLVGPGLVCGANTVLMAWIMYTSGLVPRFIGVLGLIGGPLVFAANLVKLFGFESAVQPWGGLAVVPVFAWELSVAIYLIVRGYRPAALASLARRVEQQQLGSDVAK